MKGNEYILETPSVSMGTDDSNTISPFSSLVNSLERGSMRQGASPLSSHVTLAQTRYKI